MSPINCRVHRIAETITKIRSKLIKKVGQNDIFSKNPPKNWIKMKDFGAFQKVSIFSATFFKKMPSALKLYISQLPQQQILIWSVCSNPNQSNRTSVVQWYFPLWLVFSDYCYYWLYKYVPDLCLISNWISVQLPTYMPTCLPIYLPRFFRKNCRLWNSSSWPDIFLQYFWRRSVFLPFRQSSLTSMKKTRLYR